MIGSEDKRETIPSGIEDPAYRYKMTKMNLQVMIRGNSTLTDITNIEDVATDLRVPSKLIKVWFQKELGFCFGNKDSIIKGKVIYKQLLKQLDKFILSYVICPCCGLPEIKMELDGKKGLKSICNACGNVSKHDSKHVAGKEYMKILKLEDDGNKNLESQSIQTVIDKLQKRLDKKPNMTNDQIMTYLEKYQIKHNLSYDSLHLIALCSIFNTKSRNIVKLWDQYEKLFIQLIKTDGEKGLEHFMQAIILYFIRRYKDEMSQFAPALLEKVLDNKLLSEKFVQNWFEKKSKLDKKSMLYDKKAEKAFRQIVTEFLDMYLDN